MTSTDDYEDALMTRPTFRVRRAAPALLIAAAVCLGLVACSSKPPAADPKPTATTTRPTTPPTTAPPSWPLTGMPVHDPALLDHPAVAIKISDVPEAQPHVGVDRADIVFVEPIGVSYTRIAAVFHSDLPERVGPVRSVRPMDAPLLGPMAPVFGNTMGADWVMRYVDANSDVDNLGTLRVRGTGAYELDRKRTSPNHVFAKPSVLLDLSDHTAPPKPYFDYSATPSASAGGPAATAVIDYGPRWDVTWTYDSGTQRYLRDAPWGPHKMADGKQVSATNVLVMRVASSNEKLGSGGGKAVPVLQLVNGSGSLVALTGGKYVNGTWSKGQPNEPFQLRAEDGSPLLLAPGNTWVELPTPTADVALR